MATVIGAGKYVFGEDIPMGKYNLKVVFGNGMLCIQESEKQNDESWMWLGTDKDKAKSYTGLSLEHGMYFTLNGNLEVEISKSKMIEIE